MTRGVLGTHRVRSAPSLQSGGWPALGELPVCARPLSQAWGHSSAKSHRAALGTDHPLGSLVWDSFFGLFT